MSKFRVVIKKVFDFIEIHFPAANFTVLFLCYVIMIAYRYIFYASLSWIYEISLIAFVWCCLFTASYGSRAGKHVAFTILYDKFPEKGKLIIRLIGNLFVFVMFVILLPYSFDYLSFAGERKSSIIGIPYNFIYFPFIVFVVLTLIHYIFMLVKDIRQINKLWKGRPEI